MDESAPNDRYHMLEETNCPKNLRASPKHHVYEESKPWI